MRSVCGIAKIAKVEVTEGSPMPVLDALLIIRRRSKDTDFEDLLVSQFCQILETVKASPETAVHLEETTFHLIEDVRKDQVVVSFAEAEMPEVLERQPGDGYR